MITTNKFTIPETMGHSVKELILNTESMDNEERQYWFDIWYNLSLDQQDRLISILETEKAKLDELEKRYQEEIKNLQTPFTSKEEVIEFINS